MKQVLIRGGGAFVTDVPTPVPGRGEVLVRVAASCLSIGTEMSSVRSSGVPIWKRALQKPEKVLTAVNMAATTGLKRTWELIKQKQDSAYPTGYSAAGVVIQVGEDVRDLAPGDRVACGGGGYALHAEFIRVPRNLCALMPDGLDWESACTATLGAIALQGLRRATPTLGETFVVIGLGILGQLSVQLLKANGCRVIGMDLERDRIDLACRLGADIALHPAEAGDVEQVARLTDGLGADGVIITAATPSDEVVSAAFRMCRRKGRVVLVGDVGLKLNREDFYEKEIDFLISTSYGPGRYDRRYEEEGLDYPAAYVRWTENRNMAEYLRLLSEGRVRISPLVSARYPVTEAAAAFSSVGDRAKHIAIVLTYPEFDATPSRSLRLRADAASHKGIIRVAVVGAGSFAQSAHLPNLRELGDRFALQAVVTKTGHVGTAVAQQFGAAYASTDFEEVLADRNVDAVIIATRHNLHAQMALAALRSGKHVFVEKPTALVPAELEELNEFITGPGARQVMMTGFNRRFSPYARCMMQLLKGRSGPFILNYRMNAGFIPNDHWVHGVEGGGRNLGEACHIYDLFTYLCDAAVKEISTHAISPRSHHYGRTDNFVTTLSFEDGSVCSLVYTALGHPGQPKELADLYVDGKVASLDDYKRMEVFGAGNLSLKTRIQDKGLKDELVAFADGINGGRVPIPWWQQLQVARIGLLVEQQLIGPTAK